MHLDRRDQQVRIIRPPSIHLIVDDDLVLCLLQLHQLAEFGGPGRLSLTDHLGRTGHYRINGPAFVYSDRDSGRVITILGYPDGSKILAKHI